MEVSLITGGCSNVGITYTICSGESNYAAISHSGKSKFAVEYAAAGQMSPVTMYKY
jgi:hypothetical protein